MNRQTEVHDEHDAISRSDVRKNLSMRPREAIANVVEFDIAIRMTGGGYQRGAQVGRQPNAGRSQLTEQHDQRGPRGSQQHRGRANEWRRITGMALIVWRQPDDTANHLR